MAQTNDVVSLKFLPAILGAPEGGSRTFDSADAKPDVVRTEAACRELGKLPAGIVVLGRNAPMERKSTGLKVTQLGDGISELARLCSAAVGSGDPAALKGNEEMGAQFKELARLEMQIGNDLHEGARCPERLRGSVQTCAI